MTFRIVALNSLGPAARTQAAEILVAAFAADYPNAWPTLDEALTEVDEALAQDHLALAAVDEHGVLSGWVGAIRAYDGHAWELHPLAVYPQRQGQGVGSALVAALEEHLRSQGVTTVYLGSDDESGATSLFGRDLYPNVLQQLSGLAQRGRHPFTFYVRLGYQVVGIIPDANGPGKPDILMSKRLTAGFEPPSKPIGNL